MQMGTQLIFLTATLPPQDEEDFFQVVYIPLECMHIFYSPTTHRNIRYQVYKVEGDGVVEAIYQLVEKKLEQYLAPSKIVVYGGSVE